MLYVPYRTTTVMQITEYNFVKPIDERFSASAQGSVSVHVYIRRRYRRYLSIAVRANIS